LPDCASHQANCTSPRTGSAGRPWSKKASLGNSIPTLLEDFAHIQSTDIVLPVRDGRSVRLRCIVRPDRAQSILLDHLGLILPERLKIPKGIRKCSANFS